jgi:TolA-binding protein
VSQDRPGTLPNPPDDLSLPTSPDSSYAILCKGSWPESKLARYCHYYNGLFSQHKKEYDKAIASFKIVAENHPEFVFADAANYGIAECLMAQGKRAEARGHVAALQKAIRQRSANVAGSGCVSALVDRLADQIRKEGTDGR